MSKKTKHLPAPALVNRTQFRVRFSDIDSMQIVWHGQYIRYFEDGREAFGAQFGLRYMDIHAAGYMAPIVDVNCQYKLSLSFNDEVIIETAYYPTQAAKIQFHYTVFRASDMAVCATGSSTQVFINANTRELEICNPNFFVEWKKRNNIK
ncbi:MAG: acyl-CoA thioesterase [Salinivirgaceae bacterium]|nr:acyl-CoA thioesterase [Salinivirgaceae bacterium]